MSDEIQPSEEWTPETAIALTEVLLSAGDFEMLWQWQENEMHELYVKVCELAADPNAPPKYREAFGKVKVEFEKMFEDLRRINQEEV